MNTSTITNLVGGDDEQIMLRQIASLRVVRDTAQDPMRVTRATAEIIRVQNILYKRRMAQLTRAV